MGQVAITLNGRTYRLLCGAGEEQRLLALSGHLKSKVDALVAQFGQVGEDRLLLMAALLIADELFDARDQPAAMEKTPVGSEPLPVKSRAAPIATAQAGPKLQGKPVRSASALRKADAG